MGAVIMVVSRAPFSRSGVQLTACVFGLAAYLITTRVRSRLSRTAAAWLAWVAVGVVASTLLAQGLAGVQRWHSLGPLLVHPSALLMPALVVFAAEEQARRPFLAHGVLWAVQVAHFLQPDAGQATALGLAGALIASAGSASRRSACLVAAYLMSATVTWLRHDPLPPAAFVEDILQRGFALSPVLGVAALVSLGMLLLAPLVGGAKARFTRTPATALAAYFAGSLVAPCFGEFPVPLLGFGSSPMVGAFLGLAVLQRLEREPARPGELEAARSKRKRPSRSTLRLSALG